MEVMGLGEIGHFRFWCQKILPAVYDDSMSYYELLCKVIQKLNEEIDLENEQSEAIKIIVEELTKLRDDFDKFIDHGFEDYYEDLLNAWIDSHMEYIYAHTIGQIFFSLDDSGYLIAHVPVGWEQIIFSTPLDYSDQTTYGRLCLTYGFDNELTYNYLDYLEG